MKKIRIYDYPGTYEELMEKKGKFYELKSLNDINTKMAEEALS